MKVTETKNEGLKRAYKVVLPAGDIDAQVDKKLSHIAQTIKLPGFRPGKVPLTVVKKKHGQAVFGEVVQDAVRDSSVKMLSEKQLNPALQPKIDLKDDFAQGQDLEYDISFEIYPQVPEIAFDGIKLKRAKVQVTEKEIKEGLDRLQKSQKEFEPLKKKRAAKKGDTVVIDFKGKADGKYFEGGSAEDFRLELGSNQFIPGYEDQLIGVKPGEEKLVKVTFPKNYSSPDLAGKEAEFEVNLKEVLAPKLPTLDDEFAKKLSYDNLDALKDAIKEQIAADFEELAKTKLKKELFDQIDDLCKFEVPEGMVEIEYQSLMQSAGAEEEVNTAKEKKAQEKEYRELSLRRVRLGIMLAELGRANDITVSEDELRKAVFDQARAYPGQEQQVIEVYQKNPGALEQLRGPILEGKVVEHLLEKVKITDAKATVEELLEFHEGQS